MARFGQRYMPVQQDPRLEDNSAAPATCCDNLGSGFAPSESMDLHNDPRFFNDNVIDKRLTAFTALSVVSSIIAGCACDQFSPFWEDVDGHMLGTAGAASQPVRCVIYVVGFGLMCLVLLLNTLATMTFGIQFYFMYRLVTSGPLGFETARAYYLNPTMTYWRQLSVKSLVLGLPMFTCSVGCMLFARMVSKNPERHVLAWFALLLFCAFSAVLLRVGCAHQAVFSQKLSAGTQVRPLLFDVEGADRGYRNSGRAIQWR